MITAFIIVLILTILSEDIVKTKLKHTAVDKVSTIVEELSSSGAKVKVKDNYYHLEAKYEGKLYDVYIPRSRNNDIGTYYKVNIYDEEDITELNLLPGTLPGVSFDGYDIYHKSHPDNEEMSIFFQ